MPDNYDFTGRQQEIEDLVMQNDFSRATKRLLDFIQDMQRLQDRVSQYRIEAIGIVADANEYQDDKRKGTKDWDTLNRIKHIILDKILTLLSTVIDFLKSLFQPKN